MFIRRIRYPLATAAVVLAAAACHPTGESELDRPLDPVVLTGDDLPRVASVAPTDVLAFNYVDDRWHQIPVQVDEMHVENLGIIHNRPAGEGLDFLVYSDAGTLTGADPDPDIDLDDEIVFMADDAGQSAPSGESEPEGVLADSGFEIEVTDPVDGGDAGYVYLFQRAPGNAESQAAGHDYVDYDFVLENGSYPQDYVFESPYDPVNQNPPKPNVNPEDSIVTTGMYSTHFTDRWLNDGLSISAGGSSGVDILERDMHWYFPGNCGRTEGSFAAGHGALVSNIDGPVRAIRDYIGANSGQYTQKRHVFYQGRQDVTIFLRVHPAAETPDDLHDYSEEAIGMTYRNSLN